MSQSALQFLSEEELEKNRQWAANLFKNNNNSNSNNGSTNNFSNSSQFLSNQKDLWETAFTQRQQEAESNAQRAFRYRDQEANRQFGFDKDLSRQTFEQDRTIQGDSLASSERRDAARYQAQERMADLQQRLRQRQQESERGAAMSVFRGR